MSEGMPFGLTFAEKILGIIIALIGLILAYYSLNSPDVSGIARGFFIAGGIILIMLGLLLLIAKTE